MNRGRLISLLGGLAIAAGCSGHPRHPGDLIGDYQLQGTRASSGPGPVLLDVGGANSFQSDSVLGTSRQVLRFPLHSGVQMRLPESVGQRRRIRSSRPSGWTPSPATRESSIPRLATRRRSRHLQLDGMAAIYPDGPEVDSEQLVFAANTWATVAVTSAPPTRQMFVNGNLVAQADETSTSEPTPALLQGRRDAPTTPNRPAPSPASAFSAGSERLGGQRDRGKCDLSGACSAPPTPQSTITKKKCKKHKKKHRSAESAKKKCKKKKKR